MEDVRHERRAARYIMTYRVALFDKGDKLLSSNVIFHEDRKIGMWLKDDQILRAQKFVLVSYQIFADWLNMAYERPQTRLTFKMIPKDEEKKDH